MNCIICFEKMKGGSCEGMEETYGSQRCITCSDSWVCGTCFDNWFELVCKNVVGASHLVMPCGICKKPMNYSNLVNRFHGRDFYQGSWEWEMEYEDKPVWKYLDKLIREEMKREYGEEEEV